MTIVDTARLVTGGVDTHLECNVVAALDPIGGLLGVAEFGTDSAGHDELLRWLSGFGEVARVGVEGTGSYGAGLARFLRHAGIEVFEVDRPNRQARRRRGKSDTVDAIEAARAAQADRQLGAAKTRDGNVEAIRRWWWRNGRPGRPRSNRSIRSAISVSPLLRRSASPCKDFRPLIRWPPGALGCDRGPGPIRSSSLPRPPWPPWAAVSWPLTPRPRRSTSCWNPWWPPPALACSKCSGWAPIPPPPC